MDRHRQLLEEIRADPDNDTPRRKYADYLTDHPRNRLDSLRGEFVHLHLDDFLVRGDASCFSWERGKPVSLSPDTPALDRLEELLLACHFGVMDHNRGKHRRHTFMGVRRGFLHTVRTTANLWVQYGRKQLNQEPVEDLELYNWFDVAKYQRRGLTGADRLLDCKSSSKLRRITLLYEGGTHPEVMEAYASHYAKVLQEALKVNVYHRRWG